MIVAHLPAGFLLTTALGGRTRAQLAVGLAGSMAPDLDLLYFYTIDNCQHLHHSYWSHIPVFWLGLTVLVTIAYLGARQPLFLRPVLWLFLPNVFLHLLLDSVAGGIRWLYPVSQKSYCLFSVPSRCSHWLMNFLGHWTFLLEAAIVLFAMLVWIILYRSSRRRKQNPNEAGS